ncbi:ankyrin repeat-containing domain protein [Mycena rebaudengoi]|nr:ankyrin repeat-containing domain protein [Mycena rebaudengoi]
MAAIGIWLWLDPGNFGTPSSSSCVPTLTVVGSSVPFYSPVLRIFSLAMYFLILIPGFNLLPPILFFLLLHIAYNGCIRQNRTIGRSAADVYTAFLVIGLVLLVVINIIFLVDIELTLSRNKHLQSGEDDLWVFGQVLALLLLVMPLRDAWNALRDIRTTLRGVQQQYYQALQEDVEATPLVERLQDLVNQGADPKECFKVPGFENLFQLAACRGRKDVMEIFLNESGDVIDTKPTGTYGTALQAASAKGHITLVQLLLDSRNDKEKYINIVGGYYETALCAACVNEEFEVAELLVEEGAKAERAGKRFGSPLHVATLVGNTRIITLLLGHLEDKDANSTWDIFGTALDVAKLLKNDTVVKLLTERGLKEWDRILVADDSFFTLTQQVVTCKSLSFLHCARAADDAFSRLHNRMRNSRRAELLKFKNSH